MDRHGRGPFSDNGIEINSLGLTIPRQSRGGPYIYGHMDYKTAPIDLEYSINLLFRYGAKRSPLVSYACIGKDNVNAALILCTLRVEPVKVLQIGNIPLDGCDIFSDFRNSSIEFLLS